MAKTVSALINIFIRAINCHEARIPFNFLEKTDNVSS